MSENAKKQVRVYHGVTKSIFDAEISAKREPAILRGLDIGSACSKWSPEYLAQCGGEKTVKIHVCPTGRMDFIHKNFVYKYGFFTFYKRLL